MRAICLAPGFLTGHGLKVVLLESLSNSFLIMARFPTPEMLRGMFEWGMYVGHYSSCHDRRVASPNEECTAPTGPCSSGKGTSTVSDVFGKERLATQKISPCGERHNSHTVLEILCNNPCKCLSTKKQGNSEMLLISNTPTPHRRSSDMQGERQDPLNQRCVLASHSK